MPKPIVQGMAAVVLTLSLTVPAAAETVAAPPAAETPAHTPPAEQLRDEQVVKAAVEAAGTGGPRALGRHIRKVQAVLDHAPPTFPLQERRDGLIILRADDGHDAVAQTLISLLAAPKGKKAAVVREYNTYPMAALVVASHAIERKRPEAALTALDKGLAMQPANPMLVSEKAMALYQLDRAPEALALLDKWLAPDRKVARAYKARMLRAKGYGLIELDRLGEAETAYRAALELEPDHELAKNQLQHIAELRAGRPRREASLTTTGKAAKSAPLAP